MSQENLQTMIMQSFEGGKRGVLWDCASSEYSRARAIRTYSSRAKKTI